MKKMIVAVALVVMSFSSYAGVRCERSPMGGSCCWDTDRDGPFKPIGC